MCWRYAGGGEAFRSPWPYLVDDFPLHHANAVATRAHFANSGTNAGYDPFAFAGHVKSSFWPTNPQLELLMAGLGRWVRPELVSKGYALATAMLLPISLVVSGLLLRLSAGTIAGAVAMWTAAFWQSWPFQTHFFFRFGMIAFVASVAWSLPAAAACWRWFDTGRKRDAALAAGLLALACMAHPTVPAILGPPLFASFWIGGPSATRCHRAADRTKRAHRVTPAFPEAMDESRLFVE